MILPLHFSKYLDADSINSTAVQFGFAVPENVEKFIMDFEMQHQVIQELECITRGGMCMPFHTNEEARRLSIDIDLVTPMNISETDRAIDKIRKNLTEVSIQKIVPKNGYPIPNIVSYNVGYRSCLGKDDHIKVDFLCDVDVSLPKKTQKSNFDIFNFSIDYPFDLLTHGALMGDKLTTLALEQIGLPQRKFSDIPKQIYDIGILLKLGSKPIFEEAISTFEIFTSFKAAHYEVTPRYTIDDIVTGIETSLSSLLNTKFNITLTEDQDSRFGQFKGTYLGNSRDYKKIEHISDILLIQYFIKLIYGHIDKSLSMENSVNQLEKTIAQLKEISTYNAQMRIDEHKKLYGSMPNELPFQKKILKGVPMEHIFLINEILNLKN